MLKSNKVINNYSDEFREQLQKELLTVDESAIFRLIGADRIDAFGNPIIPASQNVPATDYIIDPHTRRPVMIGLVKSIKTETEFEKEGIFFTRGKLGQIVINGDQPNLGELYLYLKYSNYNADNPARNKKVFPIYNHINPSIEAAKEMDKFEVKVEALNWASSMSEEQMRNYATSKGAIGDTMEIFQLRKLVANDAETDPKTFLDYSKNTATEVIADIKRAQKLGILRFEINNNSWVWNSSSDLIHSVPRTSEKEGAFAGYLKTKEGKTVYKEITRMIKDKTSL